MRQIEVTRGTQLSAGDSTDGIIRAKAFESERVTVSRSQVAGGVASAWHHHGGRHLYGFLVSGRLRLEYGPNGTELVDLEPGDFFHIPPRLVHRDVNNNRERELVVVNVLVGRPVPVVNVSGPGG